MKDLRGTRGSLHIARLIAQGEHSRQDFKYAVGDARKIARSISAFANREGGRLLIGVRDNGSIAGVRNDEDIYVVEQAAQMYCHPAQQVKATPYRTSGGLVVVVIDIAPATVRPVAVREKDGSFRAYYRVADENVAVPPLMARAWRERDGLGGSPLAFTPSALHSSLMDMASHPGGVTVDEFATAVHTSLAQACDMAVELYRSGLIDFTHRGTGFALGLPRDAHSGSK